MSCANYKILLMINLNNMPQNSYDSKLGETITNYGTMDLTDWYKYHPNNSPALAAGFRKTEKAVKTLNSSSLNKTLV